MFQYFPAPEKIAKQKGAKKAKLKGAPKPKEMQPFQDPQYQDLNAHYVMNNVIQMPTGKFNNLYDSVTLYLDPEFSTDKAVEHILGRFDPEAKASSKYFVKECKMRIRVKK